MTVALSISKRPVKSAPLRPSRFQSTSRRAYCVGVTPWAASFSRARRATYWPALPLRNEMQSSTRFMWFQLRHRYRAAAVCYQAKFLPTRYLYTAVSEDSACHGQQARLRSLSGKSTLTDTRRRCRGPCQVPCRVVAGGSAAVEPEVYFVLPCRSEHYARRPTRPRAEAATNTAAPP